MDFTFTEMGVEATKTQGFSVCFLGMPSLWIYLGGSIVMGRGTPIAGWFIMESTIKNGR